MAVDDVCSPADRTRQLRLRKSPDSYQLELAGRSFEPAAPATVSKQGLRIDTRRLSLLQGWLSEVRGTPQRGKDGLRHGSRQPGVSWGTFTQLACSLEIRFTPVLNVAFFAGFGVLKRHNSCSAPTAL